MSRDNLALSGSFFDEFTFTAEFNGAKTMDSPSALVFFTIGAAIIIAVFFLFRHHRDSKNKAATKEVMTGGSSAHTAVRGSGPKPEHVD